VLKILLKLDVVLFCNEFFNISIKVFIKNRINIKQTIIYKFSKTVIDNSTLMAKTP